MDARQDGHERNTATHNKHRTESRVQVGSKVAVPVSRAHVPASQLGEGAASKTLPRFVLPFEVLEIDDRRNAIVSAGEQHKSFKIHLSHVKLITAEAAADPVHPGQPSTVKWRDGTRKIRIVIDKRWRRRKAQYLVGYWGQHNVHNRWVEWPEVQRSECRMLKEFDRQLASKQKAAQPSAEDAEG